MDTASRYHLRFLRVPPSESGFIIRDEEASGSITLRSTIIQQLSSTLYHNHVPLLSNSVMTVLLAASSFASLSSTMPII